MLQIEFLCCFTSTVCCDRCNVSLSSICINCSSICFRCSVCIINNNIVFCIRLSLVNIQSKLEVLITGSLVTSNLFSQCQVRCIIAVCEALGFCCYISTCGTEICTCCNIWLVVLIRMKDISCDCQFLCKCAICICRSIIYIHIKDSCKVSVICDSLVCTGLCDNITVNAWLCKLYFRKVKCSSFQCIFLSSCKVFYILIFCCIVCIGAIALLKHDFICFCAFTNACHCDFVCINTSENLEFFVCNTVSFCITCCYCIRECSIRYVCLTVHNQEFIECSCFWSFNCCTIVCTCCSENRSSHACECGSSHKCCHTYLW